VRQAGRVQIVTVVLKVLPLLGIGLFGVLHLDPAHFVPFNLSDSSNAGAVLATASLTLWAFMGLESATIPANDVKTPEKTIPRATLLGVALATLIYVLCTVGVFGLIDPRTLAASNAPFADAARELWGEGAGYVVAGGAVISCFGALNGWILNTGRVPHAAACDGLLPAPLARLGQRQTPVFALVLSAVVTCVLIALNSARGLVGLFQFAILLSTLAVLVPYLFSALARIRLTLRAETSVGRARALWISALSLVFSLAAIVGTGWTTIAYGLVLFVIGVPVYLWLVGRQKAT
jgi:APA family basic amino acid/polyamine antiporter